MSDEDDDDDDEEEEEEEEEGRRRRRRRRRRSTQYLNATAVLRNEGLDGGGVEATSELLLLGLLTGHDGDGEDLLVHAAVQLQNVQHLLAGLLEGREGAVAYRDI
jgi:hypothetical protein